MKDFKVKDFKEVTFLKNRATFFNKETYRNEKFSLEELKELAKVYRNYVEARFLGEDTDVLMNKCELAGRLDNYLCKGDVEGAHILVLHHRREFCHNLGFNDNAGYSEEQNIFEKLFSNIIALFRKEPTHGERITRAVLNSTMEEALKISCDKGFIVRDDFPEISPR